MTEPTAPETSEKIINPFTGAELTPDDVEEEVTDRVYSLQYALKQEIEKALQGNPAASVARNFLKAFLENHPPRLTSKELKSIAEKNGPRPVGLQINNINKVGVLPNNYLRIESETERHPRDVVSRVICNTRILLSHQPVSSETINLHEEVRALQPNLEPKEVELLEFIIDQYLGIPLSHLALYTEIDEARVREIIEKINLALAKKQAVIHVRYGIAIIGDKNGQVTIFDNKETRQNLFPRKKGKPAEIENLGQKVARLEAELAKALAANVVLEKDVQEALKMAEEAGQESNLMALQKQVTGLQEEVKKLTTKSAATQNELRSAQQETRTARENLRASQLLEPQLRQQLATAQQQATEAESARAEAVRGHSRGAGQKIAQKDHELNAVNAELTKLQQDLDLARRDLQRERAKITISPEELAKLKQAATTLDQLSQDTIAALQNQIQQLNTALVESIKKLETKSEENAELKTTIERLRTELRELNELLETMTDTPTPAQTTTAPTTLTDLAPQNTSTTPVVITKTATPAHSTPTQTTPAPKPKPEPQLDPIKAIEKGNFHDGTNLLQAVNRALLFHGGSKGLEKKKLHDIRNALTALSELNDWTKQTRNKTVQALADMKNSCGSSIIPVEKIQEFVTNSASLSNV